MTFRLLASLVLLAVGLKADVTLAPLFCNHAVLQSDKPVPVWGRADPGEQVTVSFRGQSVGTTALPDGQWSVLLPAFQATREGSVLEAVGKTTISVSDVLVGEVWVCSGQSNMEFVVYDSHGTVFRVKNGPAEVAAAHFPLIRHFRVQKQTAKSPQESVGGSWEVCSPETVGQFTAVGYFFARSLQARLGVPVGLVNASWGGTPIEAWMSPLALASDPAFRIAYERWQADVASAPGLRATYLRELATWTAAEAAAKAKGTAAHAAFLKKTPKPREPRAGFPQYEPEVLFNGMINPLLPYAIRGFLWYQGEQNATHPEEYHALFAAMITAWRSHFGQGDLPFYFVQLANFKAGDGNGTAWARLREAQAQVLTLPATGMAVTIDIGDPDNIHPTNKQEVGRRLALIANASLYGASADYSGPVFASAMPEGSAMRVRFSQSGIGLIARDKPVQSLELAGADHVFYPAEGKIEGDTLKVVSPKVHAPIAVRYAWRNAPVANLYNGAGLPAAPFRSDGW